MVNPQPLNDPSSDDKLWSGLSYAGVALCLIPTVAIFFIKKEESRFIKFHALQAIFFGLVSLVVCVALNIVAGVITGILPFLFFIFMLVPAVFGLAVMGYWIYLMIMGFTGKDVRIPVLADFIDQNLMG